MESVEKQMVPLVDIPTKNDEYFVEKPTEKTSRSRRKLVLVLVVISAVIIVILAVTLIAIYVTKHLRDAENEPVQGSIYKGPLTGELEVTASPKTRLSSTVAHSPSSVVTKPTPTATLADFKLEETSAQPNQESTRSSILPTSSIVPWTAIADLVPNTAATSSLIASKTVPSPKATSAVSEQLQTYSLSSIVSLSTNIKRTIVSPIISSMSKVRPMSSVAGLTVIANLLPNKESKWSRWSSWSDCTKTCDTGTRYRNRTCVAINQDAVFAPISCAGKPTQTKSCAVWSCPDCSRNCTTGTLDAACDACTCNHHVLTGRALTVDYAPLFEAKISLAETPYKILAQTNISGHFTAFGVCAIQQELRVTKEGFVSVTQKANILTSTVATLIAKLTIAAPPFVTVHPESKLRMPGQAVTFCCNGQGNPPPEIEWFKENNIIDKEFYSYNNTLEITAEHGLNGSYRCRVVNNFGSEFSNSATLKILGYIEHQFFNQYDPKPELCGRCINTSTTASEPFLLPGE